MQTLLRAWSPPGPVTAQAYASFADPVLVMGPPGSGKTGMFINKAIAGTLLQKPYADGIRRARLWVLAIDYRRLWGNFMPSWFEWIPQEAPDSGITWSGARGGPAQQTIKINSAKHGRGELEVIFEAIGDDRPCLTASWRLFSPPFEDRSRRCDQVNARRS